MNDRATEGRVVGMGLRIALLALALLTSAACAQAPAPVNYLSVGSDSGTPSQNGVVVASVPIPQPKPNQPGATMTDVPIDPITLRMVPPLPQRKPVSQAAVATTETEQQSTTGFVDEDIVLAPPAEPAAEEVVVQPGDTVYALSRRYGVAVRDILQANDLAPPYLLLIGQTIKLPAQRTHVVRGGETIYGISRAYGITTSELVRANDLHEPYQLYVGQRLVLPAAGGSVPVVPETETGETEVALAVPEVEPAPEPTTFSGIGVPLPNEKPLPPPTTGPVTVADIPARTGGKFSWPVHGQVLSSYGPKANGLHNDGINIAAPAGTPVLAAEDGVVAYVGDELAGYGNLVLLRHGDGWVTAYAHNAEIKVVRGQRVTRGQVIATVGASGNVTTPQTHFEIRKGSEAVDPMLYLESS